MPSNPPGPSSPPQLAARGDAEQLVQGVLALMSDLGTVLEAETAQVRVGRIHDGLASEARKSELAGRYTAALETVKANAVALARLAPDALGRLKEAHGRFGRVVEANQTVLATARAVTEGLIKSLADDLARGTRPHVYGASGAMAGYRQGNRGEPLVLSRHL